MSSRSITLLYVSTVTRSLFVFHYIISHSLIYMFLTLPSTASPFPYAAAALATYTKQAELVFNDASTDVFLDLNGTVVSGEEKIVEELAKSGGLSSDSTAV